MKHWTITRHARPYPSGSLGHQYVDWKQSFWPEWPQWMKTEDPSGSTVLQLRRMTLSCHWRHIHERTRSDSVDIAVSRQPRWLTQSGVSTDCSGHFWGTRWANSSGSAPSIPRRNPGFASSRAITWAVRGKETERTPDPSCSVAHLYKILRSGGSGLGSYMDEKAPSSLIQGAVELWLFLFAVVIINLSIHVEEQI